MPSSNSQSKKDEEYIFLFFASGSIGVIQKWLQDDMKKPAKEMAELILRISINSRA